MLSGSLAERARRADVQLEEATEEIADLQAFNQYIVDNLLSGLATADAHNRLLTFNRSAMAITGIAGDAADRPRDADVLQLPARLATLDEDLQRARSKRLDYEFRQPEGRVDRDRPERRATAAAGREPRLSLHVPGRHRGQAHRAQRADAAAARSGR